MRRIKVKRFLDFFEDTLIPVLLVVIILFCLGAATYLLTKISW